MSVYINAADIVLYWIIAVLFSTLIAIHISIFCSEDKYSWKNGIYSFVGILCVFGFELFTLATPPHNVNKDAIDVKEYYVIAYKSQEFTDLDGFKKVILITENNSYLWKCDDANIPDYNDCVLRMDDNGTPNVYDDDNIIHVFWNEKG